ncbi:hypothetical protein CS063_11875 [Sporanaerobium hydrogeniformans]|uniref:Uncharacterized protein n=1 Tax=Sporanaerobium hydrogeniformans TaxID=3072179 RepID=A0AC61DAA0_9FIRM|nr:hypothetical protein [Sporanaerobium hydrogeniformans]PHV70169.1 hypothetical protein CS063_11875 [Sporanaerobium hydrogeniformans]
MKEENFNEKIALPATLSFIAFMVYNLSIKFISSAHGDIFKHIEYAEKMFEGTYKTATPIYYFVWGFFNKVLCIEKNISAAYADVFFSILCAISIYLITRLFLKDSLGEWGRCLVVIFMTFFGPLYFPSFSSNYYLGQGTFNTWHNPTNNSVKFIAISALFLFIYYFNMDENEKIFFRGKNISKRSFLNIIVGLLSFISVFIKPSFFQVFAPTIVIVYLIDWIRTKRNIIFYIKDGVVFIPATLVIFYDVFFLFFSSTRTRGGIEIAPLDVWNYYSPNIIISILITITFPLFTIFLKSSKQQSKNINYIPFIFYIVALLEFALLAEHTGRYSGNFMWGMNLGIGILFLYSIFKFIKYNKEYSTNSKIITRIYIYIFIGYVLLASHFLWGIWYYFQLLVRPMTQCF